MSSYFPQNCSIAFSCVGNSVVSRNPDFVNAGVSSNLLVAERGMGWVLLEESETFLDSLLDFRR